MELRVFDKTVQPLGAIDELASLLCIQSILT